ncbi:hypothetical protein D3C75_1288750 [compost metagenome]
MTSIVEGQLETAGDQALGDAGGAQQEDALTAEGGQQTEPQGVLPLVESLAEGRQQSGQTLMNGDGTNSILG